MKTEKQHSVHKCQCVTCHHHPTSAAAKAHRAINRVLAALDEKNRRRFVGLLALQWGRGGLERLHEMTGLSRPTIRRGCREIQRAEPRSERGRVRKAGGGRRAVEKNTPRC
jgi:hypothetical protein